MYISLKWVQNITGLNNISLNELCEKLTLAGFEIEEIIKKYIVDKEDLILDVSLTANRSDLFNVKAFSQELNSIFFQEAKLRKKQVKDLTIRKNMNFLKKGISLNSYTWERYLQEKYFYKNQKNTDNSSLFEGCFNFFSIESSAFKVKSAPLWIQKYLISSGITPTNNILDTINFVTLETGYPFFAFDLNKLKNYLNTSSFSFSVCKASTEYNFLAEPNKNVILQPNNLLLRVNNKVISVIGLLNIKDLEVDDNTTNILLYSGLFDAVQVRKSSQALGIRTEQSISLEKNLNPNGLEQAFIRLSLLLKVQSINLEDNNLPKIYHLDTSVKKYFTNYVQNTRPLLKLNYKEVNNLLGFSKLLNEKNIIDILKALNFKIVSQDETSCELYIPFSREFDIEREVDLIEEIVRINGFANFVPVLPSLKKLGNYSKLEKLKRLLRKSFINLGFSEVLHYSLSAGQSPFQLELKNPIVLENSFFRLNLLNQLIQKASSNKKQKNSTFEAFEIGRAYNLSKNGNVQEFELISGIFGGNLYRTNWNEDERPINWFEAKGLINKIFDILGISIMWSNLDEPNLNFFHPGRTAELSAKNNIVGRFGQIHPMVAKKNYLIEETFLFEFNLEILELLWQEKKIYTYNAYPLYPATLIDLACIKSDIISYNDIELKISEIGYPLLESISLFDYYSGAPIPEGCQSLGFKLKFRNFDRTLTNEEVDNTVKQITKCLEENFDIKIRK